jgi:hypothetical protein
VIWSSEKVCVVPSEVYTVVGGTYTLVEEEEPEGVEVGGKLMIVVMIPIVTVTGGGTMLDWIANVEGILVEPMTIFENQIEFVVTKNSEVSPSFSTIIYT